MDLGLNNKRALVLGASRGLGAAIAEGLAREGATVIAAARSKDKIEAWAGKLPDGAGTVEACALDISDLAAIDELADRLLAEGGVDILVNNTGGPPRHRLSMPVAATGSRISRPWRPMSST